MQADFLQLTIDHLINPCALWEEIQRKISEVFEKTSNKLNSHVSEAHLGIEP
jgi:hypothetical protein